MNETQLLGALNDAILATISHFETSYGSRPDSIYLTPEQHERIKAIYASADMPSEVSRPDNKIMGLTIKELPQASIDTLPPNTCLISLDADLEPKDMLQECISLDLSPLFKEGA